MTVSVATIIISFTRETKKSHCTIQGLTSDLLLPPHLIIEVVELLEEVIDLAALVISLCGGEHTHF